MGDQQSYKADNNSNSLQLESKNFNWTTQLDEELKELHVLYQGSWKAISLRLSGPTPLECLQRWGQLHPDQSRTRQLWSPEEDEQLQELVQKFGKKWSKICTVMNWRTGKQVRERYLNQLQGTINNSKWSEEEDKLILKLYKKFGTKWSYISSFLNGRPENMVKNRFYANLRRRFHCDSEDSDDEEFDSQSSQREEKSSKNRRKRAQVSSYKEVSKIKKSDIGYTNYTRMTRSKISKNSDSQFQQDDQVKEEDLQVEERIEQEQPIKVENFKKQPNFQQQPSSMQQQQTQFLSYPITQPTQMTINPQLGLVQLQQSMILPLQFVLQQQQLLQEQEQQQLQQQQQEKQTFQNEQQQNVKQEQNEQQEEKGQQLIEQLNNNDPTNSQNLQNALNPLNSLLVQQWNSFYQQLTCQMISQQLQATQNENKMQ